MKSIRTPFWYALLLLSITMPTTASSEFISLRLAAVLFCPTLSHNSDVTPVSPVTLSPLAAGPYTSPEPYAALGGRRELDSPPVARNERFFF